MFMERPAGCSWNGWPDAVECAGKRRRMFRSSRFGIVSFVCSLRLPFAFQREQMPQMGLSGGSCQAL
jgi:hypothetical protein